MKIFRIRNLDWMSIVYTEVRFKNETRAKSGRISGWVIRLDLNQDRKPVVAHVVILTLRHYYGRIDVARISDGVEATQVGTKQGQACLEK